MLKFAASGRSLIWIHSTRSKFYTCEMGRELKLDLLENLHWYIIQSLKHFKVSVSVVQVNRSGSTGVGPSARFTYWSGAFWSKEVALLWCYSAVWNYFIDIIKQ